MQKKTQKLRQWLREKLLEIDIAGFLYEEICYMLEHLNYYKLKNLSENYEQFQSYLYEIDEQNTRSMQKLLQTT